MATLAAIRHLLIAGKTSAVGLALVPYYKHFLFMLKILGTRKLTNSNGNFTEFSYNKELHHDIEVTVQMLEKSGGPDAYLNIKYMLPTYESCDKCI